jgi:ubiquinone/menaquinone biosynthesis C-methylase UbiE
VELRRLPVDGRDVPGADRRAARRSRRHRAGARVLDIASGTGNAALPAARKGADVTASDLTPALLEAGRARAEAEGLELQWVEADAENLPFENESFDVVMSAIGVMFAPHHQEAADELVRVTRPGGGSPCSAGRQRACSARSSG